MSSTRKGSPDFLLLFMTLVLIAFGLLMVYSASSLSASYNYEGDSLHYMKRQIAAVVLGLVAMVFCMNIHYTTLRKLTLPFFFIVLVMLVLVPFIGIEMKGARSWFSLGPFNLQPAEFAKLSVILYLSALITKKGERFYNFKNGLLPAIIVVGLNVFLIFLQPDFGTCMVLTLSAALVILVGGANLKHLFLLGIGAVFFALLIIIYPILIGSSDHRLARITSFLHPEKDPLFTGFHILQSLYAFGHGGFYGAGFGQSIQKLGFLPGPHNDFIFAIIGEELGFVGSTAFLLFYLLFILRGIIIALRCPEIYGKLVGIGIIGLIGIQALVNLGGVTKSIPLTGVTLPLISYGGSSILVTIASMGILLGISREQNRIDSNNEIKENLTQ